jgi:putative transposase
MPEAIRGTWPDAEVQLCVVHLVRSSLRLTSRKYWGPICRDMREIYTAPTLEAAEARFAAFVDEWEQRYPAMIDTWRPWWAEFVPFLAFPIELRTFVYTTDDIVKRGRAVLVASARRGPGRPVRLGSRVLSLGRVAA